MVGIVTFDDAMDVMEDEATEDMEIMAGYDPFRKELPEEHPPSTCTSTAFPGCCC